LFIQTPNTDKMFRSYLSAKGRKSPMTISKPQGC
jgi:hypothetical protein